MNLKTIVCDRCARHIRGKRDELRWNVTMRRGSIVGFLCPDCQTTTENLEAEVNLATTDYHRDAFGRVWGTPKTDRQGEDVTA